MALSVEGAPVPVVQLEDPMTYVLKKLSQTLQLYEHQLDTANAQIVELRRQLEEANAKNEREDNGNV